MSCNRNDQTFQGIVRCYIEDLVNNFVITLGNDPYMNCTQNTLVTQTMNVTLENVNTSKSVPPVGYPCTWEFNQNIDLSGKKICLDINKKLAELEGEKRQQIVNNAINSSINNFTQTVKTKTNFINLLKTLTSEKLMDTDPPNMTSLNTSVWKKSVAGCSQNTNVTQTQNVKISGEIICGPNGKIEISQEAIIRSYMRCIVEPFIDELLSNPVLRTAFNYSPNANCIYDIVPISPCENNSLRAKATIISPSRGSGTCPYGEGEIITQPCTLDQCTVGPWKKVSLCENGKEKYVRKIINGGINCPETIKFENCTIPSSRPRTQPQNINQPLDENLTRLQDFISNNQFLLLNPTFTTPSQKLIAITIIFIFIILLSLIFIF